MRMGPAASLQNDDDVRKRRARWGVNQWKKSVRLHFEHCYFVCLSMLRSMPMVHIHVNLHMTWGREETDELADMS